MPGFATMPQVSWQPPTRWTDATTLAGGAIVGAALFGVVGSITDRAVGGCICGLALGGFVGWGWRSGLVSPAIVWICCFAAAGAFVGPGCDADALSSALCLGAVGAFIGYLKWRGVALLVGSLIAIHASPALFVGFLFLAGIFFIDYVDRADLVTKKSNSLGRTGRST